LYGRQLCLLLAILGKAEGRRTTSPSAGRYPSGDRISVLWVDLGQLEHGCENRWWHLVRHRVALRGLQDQLVPLRPGDDRLQRSVVLKARTCSLSSSKYRRGVVPSALRNIAIKELGVL